MFRFHQGFKSKSDCCDSFAPQTHRRPHRAVVETLEEHVLLSSYTLTTLASFGGGNQNGPVAGVILSGNTLYGTTEMGGTNGYGEVFSVPDTGGTPDVLGSFNKNDGDEPYGTLIQVSDTLYGTTQLGGDLAVNRGYGAGTVFSLPVTGGSPSVLASFDNATDGSEGSGALILSGNTLYGTAGGPDPDTGHGEVFSVPVNGGGPNVLALFDGSNGQQPWTDLILSDGTFYGATEVGGLYGGGVVFSVPLAGGTPTVLATFGGDSAGDDGVQPDALVLAGSVLYGTTNGGGANGEGEVFSLPITGGTPNVLASFDVSNGERPALDGLLLSGGTLFGTTNGNGGEIYSLPITGGTPTVLASLDAPQGDLTIDASGNIYGTTYYGGTNGDGSVFELSPMPSLTVNTLTDPITPTDGTVSLREAISAAESEGGNQTITFASGLTGTISLASQLPNISTNITIDGPGTNVITVNDQGNGSVFTVDSNATATVENLTITGGSATANGGGIDNQGTLTVTACTITSDAAAQSGGGIENAANATLTITASTLNGNTATQNGGGIANQGTLSVTNCTITANSATLGGGINDANGATVTDCTIVANSQGGGINANSTILDGSIIAQNTGGDIVGGAQGANDLIGDGSDSSTFTLSIFGTPTTPVDPLLDPLADNGGPTQTMMPLPGSRAVGNGDGFPAAAGVDQDGITRPTTQGSIDIGAFQGTIPSLLTLANLSNDVYSATPQGDASAGYLYDVSSPTEGGTDSDNAAFAANAYFATNSDDSISQIVIAIRGTVFSLFSHPVQTWDTIEEDLSVTGKAPNQILSSEVSDAVKFINTVANANSGVPIVLTGHSLGGAIAQLIGSASGLPTVTFDAPGAAALSGSSGPLATQLNAISSQVKALQDGKLINYRMFDDQVSQAGTPFSGTAGETATLQKPADIILNPKSDEVSDALANLGTYLGPIHSIVTMISQIAVDAPQVSSAGEANDTPVLQEIVHPSSSDTLTSSDVQYYVNFLATTNDLGQLIDPTSGADFTLMGQTGSPNIASMRLPTLTGVASYDVQTETGGTWSAVQVVQPGTNDDFGPDVQGVEFQPLDSNGDGVAITDSFLFAASFASAGTFTGSLLQSTSPIVLSPPTANADSYSAYAGQTLTVNSAQGVLANDTDSNSLPLAATLLTQPADGVVQLNADGSFTYTPNMGFLGTDSFTYQAEDGIADSAPATVTINVQTETTTTLAAIPLPAVYGQNETLTATVVSAAGAPTNGAVTFVDTTTGTTLGTVGLTAYSPEVQMLTVGSAGTFSLAFNGSSSTAAFTPGVVTGSEIQAALNGLSTIGGIGGSVTVSPSGSAGSFQISFGGAFNGVAEPLLSVQQNGGATTLAAITTDAGGVASLTTTALTAGTHAIIADYYGDTNSSTSSDNLSLTIQKATPSVGVVDEGGAYTGSVFPATALVNGSATLESVAPTLTYYAGSAAAGTPLAGAPFAAGTYTVVANFAGSADYNGVASAPKTFAITAIPGAPTFAASSFAFTPKETGTAGSTIGSVPATKSFSTQTITYSLIGPNALLFKISTAGAITAVGKLDVLAQSTYSFTVVVSGLSKATGGTLVSNGVPVTVTVQEVAPTITGAKIDTTVLADTATVAPMSAVVIGDPILTHLDTVTITLATPMYGTLADPATLATGKFAATSTPGVYTLTATPANLSTAIKDLVFIPAKNLANPGVTYGENFTIAVNDGTDTTTNNVTAVAIKSTNDAPAITGTRAAGTTSTTQNANDISDHATATPFANVVISDPDVTNASPVAPGTGTPQTLTVTISLSAANGTLAGTGLSGLGTAGSLYTLTGTATQVSAEIDALVFTPKEHQVAVGSTETTTFTIKAGDGVVTTPTSNAATTVIAKAANDAPTGLTAKLTTSTLKAAVPSGKTMAVVANATSVVTLGGIDPNPSDTFTYNLVSGSGSTNNADFVVGTSTKANQLLVNVTGGLGVGAYDALVQVTDKGGLSYQQALAITIGTTGCSVTLV